MNNYETLNLFINQNIVDGLITIFTLIALGVLFISTSLIVLFRVIVFSFVGLMVCNIHFFEISQLAILNSFILFLISCIGGVFGVFNDDGKTRTRYVKDIRDYMLLITAFSVCYFFANITFNSISEFFLSLNLIALAFSIFFGFVVHLTNLKLKLIILKDK